MSTQAPTTQAPAGCPHVLKIWETVPHQRYPSRQAQAHRVPVLVGCTREGWHKLSEHVAAGGRRW